MRVYCNWYSQKIGVFFVFTGAGVMQVQYFILVDAKILELQCKLYSRWKEWYDF